jgi:hypothetical protein
MMVMVVVMIIDTIDVTPSLRSVQNLIVVAVTEPSFCNPFRQRVEVSIHCGAFGLDD